MHGGGAAVAAVPSEGGGRGVLVAGDDTGAVYILEMEPEVRLYFLFMLKQVISASMNFFGTVTLVDN
jgi:hypothetical protein